MNNYNEHPEHLIIVIRSLYEGTALTTYKGA